MLVNFQLLKKALPYLNVFAIALSIVKLMIYYNAFGINILQYLELSESIILCFESVIRLLFFLILLSLASIFFMHIFGDINSGNAQKVISIDGFWKRFLFFFWHNKYLVITYVYFSWLFTPYFLFIILILYLLSEIQFISQKRYNEDFPTTYYNLILWSIYFIAFEFYFTFKEISSVKYHQRYERTMIKIDTPKEEESRIVTNSEILFVGKTKEFYFLYDTTKQSALIIPSDKVLRVDLKNKYNWFWDYPK